MAIGYGSAYNGIIFNERMVHTMKKFEVLLLSLMLCLSVLSVPIDVQGNKKNRPEFGCRTLVSDDTPAAYEPNNIIMPLDDLPDPLPERN